MEQHRAKGSFYHLLLTTAPILTCLQASDSGLDTRTALTHGAGCFGVTGMDLSLPRATRRISVCEKGNPS